MGWELVAPFVKEWRLLVCLLLLLEEELGRLRKERKAEVLRQRSSGEVLRVWR